MSKHFPLAIGQRVTVNATGTEGTIVDITFKVKFASTIYAWFYESDLIPHPPVEPLAYAIVSPPKGDPHATTGKVVARVGSHTPVLAPLVCVRLTSDARNAIGDKLDFKVDPENGAFEVTASFTAMSANEFDERAKAIEAAAKRVAEEYVKWLGGKYEYTSALFAACGALRSALAK